MEDLAIVILLINSFLPFLAIIEEGQIFDTKRKFFCLKSFFKKIVE